MTQKQQEEQQRQQQQKQQHQNQTATTCPSSTTSSVDSSDQQHPKQQQQEQQEQQQQEQPPPKSQEESHETAGEDVSESPNQKEDRAMQGEEEQHDKAGDQQQDEANDHQQDEANDQQQDEANDQQQDEADRQQQDQVDGEQQDKAECRQQEKADGQQQVSELPGLTHQQEPQDHDPKIHLDSEQDQLRHEGERQKTHHGQAQHIPTQQHGPDTHGPVLHDEALTNLQAHAQAQQAKANLMITSLRARLRKRDVELRTVREGHERQMTAVVAHLLRLEGQMQREQKEVIEALADRDDIIRRQKAALEDLTEKNERLMRALKESHGYKLGGSPDETHLPGQKYSQRVYQQNGEISIRDHGNKVVMRSTKGRSSDRSIKSSSGEFKSGNGEKPRVRFTTAMMERLRRHKSSLELYRSEPLEPLIEGSLRYFSSQDNLVDGEGEGEDGAEKVEEDGEDKSVKKDGHLQRKQRCRSLVDYPFVGEEGEEEETGGSVESCYEEGYTSSPSRFSKHSSGRSSSMSSLTGSNENLKWVRRWSSSGGAGPANGGSDPRRKISDSTFPPNSPPFNSLSSPPSHTSPSTSPSSLHGFPELSKSRSVPQALPTVCENDGLATGSGNARERPHSHTTVELLHRDLASSNSANSTSTPNLTPLASTSPPSAASESNPFKSFKNVFRRRGSKKKRSGALGQPANQEHSETVKNYFKKHDLT
ncbi:hypothetical protein PoB_007555400 [Plakobranchus ocellatus]|uniref:Uncharacterized protein n=1 Tax=Plakobranchus ocellatus TaxID=259542 RepID=A0AAV4DYA9_9GAST|nr:hypothetical protein PoB_007555400 [Plakobranchus ocellatus]